MEIKQCNHCGHIFQYPGFGDMLCPECKKVDTESFAKVKEYLYTHPHADTAEVFQATGIPLKTIMRWLREERLVATSQSLITLKCEQCGATIYTGRLCAACKHKLVAGFDGQSDEKKKVTSSLMSGKNRMRFLK